VPAPAHLRSRVHPLVSSAASSECSALSTGPSRARDERLPWGLLPLSRREREESSMPAVSQHRLPFRPQRFSRSRRFAPPRAARACFIPQPRMRFPLQGVPPVASRAGSSPARALSTLASLSCGRVAPSAPGPDAPSSGSRSDYRSIVAGGCFTPTGTRSPLEFSLPRVLRRAPRIRRRGSSAHDLVRRFLW